MGNKQRKASGEVKSWEYEKYKIEEKTLKLQGKYFTGFHKTCITHP